MITGIDKEITHIGMSDIEQCNKIIEWSINKLREKGIEYKEYVESK